LLLFFWEPGFFIILVGCKPGFDSQASWEHFCSITKIPDLIFDFVDQEDFFMIV